MGTHWLSLDAHPRPTAALSQKVLWITGHLINGYWRMVPTLVWYPSGVILGMTSLSLSFLTCDMGVRRTSQLPSQGDKAQMGKHSIKLKCHTHPGRDTQLPTCFSWLELGWGGGAGGVRQASGNAGRERGHGRLCLRIPRQPVQGSRMASWQTGCTTISASWGWNVQVSVLGPLTPGS